MTMIVSRYTSYLPIYSSRVLIAILLLLALNCGDVFLRNFLKHNRIINFTRDQFQSVLQEALTLFVSLSHCFLCSKQLISAHLALAISQPPPASGIDILSAAVVGALSVKENLIQVGFNKINVNENCFFSHKL